MKTTQFRIWYFYNVSLEVH